MESFILAAGLGTRLKPLTDDRPKALVEINGRTLLEIAICRLAKAGVERCVVNVHSFGTMLINYIAGHQWPCEVMISDEREMLLDTGGALKHAAPLFSGKEPVLVHNVDILSDIDFKKLERYHIDSGNLATLCVSDRETKRKLLFDPKGRLVGRVGENEPLAVGCRPLAFSGVSMISPELFTLLPTDDHPYPVIDAYLEIERHCLNLQKSEGDSVKGIGCFVHSADKWLDVGTPERLARAIDGQ